MSLFVTILSVILIFGFIIFIHELGHFTVAKACGALVHEFSLGMGPALWKKQWGETTYALRLLPIGGFVAVEGEDEDSDNERAINRKPVWQRILFVGAGAFMNVLFGFILMVIIVANQELVSTTTIAQFQEGATSSQVLQIGDEILEVNGAPVRIGNDIVFEFISVGSEPVDLTIIRDGETMLLEDVPFPMQTIDGITMASMDFLVYGQEKTVFSTLKEAWHMTTGVVKQVWDSFFKLVTGQYKMQQLSGPVGVSSAIGEAASLGMENLLLMVAFITINIGVFNLIPLPALDGGRLFFLLIEAVRGKPIPAKYEGFIHAAGLFLLMGLMLFVTFNDVVKLLFA